MTDACPGIQDRVELMKSVRASGVVLDAGLFGEVVRSEPADTSAVKFDEINEIVLIKHKYLRVCTKSQDDIDNSDA